MWGYDTLRLYQAAFAGHQDERGWQVGDSIIFTILYIRTKCLNTPALYLDYKIRKRSDEDE